LFSFAVFSCTCNNDKGNKKKDEETALKIFDDHVEGEKAAVREEGRHRERNSCNGDGCILS
jgi:hypothetical protein